MTHPINSGKQRHLDWILPGATSESWLVPSALLSSRWSQDNPLTPEPSVLYTGTLEALVGIDELQGLLEKLGEKHQGMEVTGGSLGVLTWNITYRKGGSSYLLILPLGIDSPGVDDRRRATVPASAFHNAHHYLERGLDRYLLAPDELIPFEEGPVGATFSLPASHHVLSFCQGRVRIDMQDSEGGWVVPLGQQTTILLLTELIAALVYHYDPEEHGGTALSDVFINDGDFLIRRLASGDYQLRLSVARHRQAQVPPHRFLLHLMQLVAYEDWTVGEQLRGLPVLMSHPSIVFAGLSRGLEHRYADLKRRDGDAEQAATRWIAAFARSPEGRGYRPWAERYLAGDRTSSFDQDPRISWWNLTELRQKRNLAQLRQRSVPTQSNAEQEALLSTCVDLLSRQLLRSHPHDDAAQLYVNDLDRGKLVELLDGAPGAEPALLDDWFERWPYRRAADLPPALLTALSPETLSRLDFRRPLPAEQDGDLQSLGDTSEVTLAVPLANPEVFGPLVFPSALEPRAAQLFPSFESYMDDALHHPRFGYYKQRVNIGRTGDFSTHPEDLSPHYGAWIARLLREHYQEMLERGELLPSESFCVVEFGAGTGRLARDIIDALRARAQNAPLDPLDRQLHSNLRYYIYELSDSLRAQQAALLGPDARIAPGDARRPKACLARDFPSGVRGIILSNELPDAFGVHKVLLSSQGEAYAVVVVPRIESDALTGLSADLRERISAIDTDVRRTFGWTRHPSDRFLDHKLFREVMKAAYELDIDARDRLLDGFWFEEGLVPAPTFPELSASLQRDSHELASALAVGNCGVVVYVNLHAESFIREIAPNLRAGMVLTIDYGGSTQETLDAARQRMFPFRVYRYEGKFVPRPNDPYARPGTQDLTADVNFTSLARAGLEAGLSLVHYGLERDIIGTDLQAALSAERGSTIEKFLGNPAFKLLALGTRPSQVFQDNFASLPLLTQAPPSSLSARMKALLARLQQE